MSDEKMTLEEAKQIQYREIDIERLEASIPTIHATMESLRKAGKVSREVMETEINI